MIFISSVSLIRNRFNPRPSGSSWLAIYLFLLKKDLIILQNYNQCYCGNALGDTNVYQRKNEDECNRPCTGDSSQLCGGHWLRSVYECK